eukprot:6198219-Pleurochrysis_carterae.AAC.1
MAAANQSHNLLRDSVYKPLLERCAAGHYAAIVASPPCSTFSVSRFSLPIALRTADTRPYATGKTS